MDYKKIWYQHRMRAIPITVINAPNTALREILSLKNHIVNGRTNKGVVELRVLAIEAGKCLMAYNDK